MTKRRKTKVKGKATSSEWQGTRPGRIDLKEAGLSQKDACLAVCDDAQIWRSPDGETFATVTVIAEDGSHREYHAVYGRTFKDWLLSRVAATYSQNGRPATANENILRDVRGSLDARAYSERVVNKAPLRVAEFGRQHLYRYWLAELGSVRRIAGRMGNQGLPAGAYRSFPSHRRDGDAGREGRLRPFANAAQGPARS